MNKVIKDGKVAVIINIDFGGGWYSWHGIEELLYDPKIVHLLEPASSRVAAMKLVRNYTQGMYPDQYFGGNDLSVQWIPQGDKFRIQEYDGQEHVVFQKNEVWLTA